MHLNRNRIELYEGWPDNRILHVLNWGFYDNDRFDFVLAHIFLHNSFFNVLSFRSNINAFEHVNQII